MTSQSIANAKVIGIKHRNVSYIERHAIRVVAFNSAGEVALVYAKRDNYYKLPGGGIDPGEDHAVAAQREMQEETGGLIKLRTQQCIAETEEYRNDLHQTSYCYVADLVDGTGKPNLTEDEIQDGLIHQWKSVDEAKDLLAAVEPKSELGRYIKERDSYLLEEATK